MSTKLTSNLPTKDKTFKPLWTSSSLPGLLRLYFFSIFPKIGIKSVIFRQFFPLLRHVFGSRSTCRFINHLSQNTSSSAPRTLRWRAPVGVSTATADPHEWIHREPMLQKYSNTGIPFEHRWT